MSRREQCERARETARRRKRHSVFIPKRTLSTIKYKTCFSLSNLLLQLHARHVLHQHPRDVRPVLFYRRSHIRLGSFRFRFQLFRQLVGPSRGLRQHVLVLLLSLVSVRLNFRFRFVFGLFNSRRFFCLFVCSKGRREREREKLVVFLSFLRTSSSRGKNQTTREKCLKKTRSRRTKTYLVSPRSRSRSPLVPPVKAFESRLVSANPFSLISLKSTFTLSLCLSLSVVLLLSKVFIYVLQKGNLLRRIVKITLLFSLSFRLVL